MALQLVFQEEAFPQGIRGEDRSRYVVRAFRRLDTHHHTEEYYNRHTSEWSTDSVLLGPHIQDIWRYHSLDYIFCKNI